MREGKLSDLKAGENRIVLGRMLAYQLEVAWRHGDVMTPGSAAAGSQAGAAGAARAASSGLREFQVSGISNSASRSTTAFSH